MAAATEVRLGVPQYPVLNDFLRCRERVSAIMGPLGSGKTFAAVQRILHQMTEQEPNAKGQRPSRWIAVRNTYPDLMGTTQKDFCAVFEGLGKMRYGGLAPPTFTVDFHLEDGTHVLSEMVFLALDREDGVRKLRGQQSTGIWFNEGKEIQKSIIDMADLRHGRYPSMASGGVECTWHGMILDTNAPDEDSWYYNLAEVVRPKGWKFFRQPGGVFPGDKVGEWIPNPDAENLENLPEGYYQRGLEGKVPRLDSRISSQRVSLSGGWQACPPMVRRFHPHHSGTHRGRPPLSTHHRHRLRAYSCCGCHPAHRGHGPASRAGRAGRHRHECGDLRT